MYPQYTESVTETKNRQIVNSLGTIRKHHLLNFGIGGGLGFFTGSKFCETYGPGLLIETCFSDLSPAKRRFGSGHMPRHPRMSRNYKKNNNN